ncbi:hypothetical protein [Paraconexibacter sp.]|uniref:hypothetical protein n=1 Tax=Paraconexibacter sp. TaxID=2949640 RepID=UPI003562ED75
MAALQSAILIRRAHAHLRTAQELRARWDALDPQTQAAARDDRDRVVDAAAAVRTRLTYGVRGFARELSAARRGEEAVPEEARPLGAVVAELAAALLALKATLDAAPVAPPED